MPIKLATGLANAASDDLRCTPDILSPSYQTLETKAVEHRRGSHHAAYITGTVCSWSRVSITPSLGSSHWLMYHRSKHRKQNRLGLTLVPTDRYDEEVHIAVGEKLCTRQNTGKRE